MSFLIGVLTFFLVILCLLLILLVLVQLPKKDAGGGMAFGGGTGDALFGAGTGNALTRITKWATVIFVAMAVILGYLQDRAGHGSSSSNFAQQVEQKQNAAPSSSPAAAPTTVPQTTPSPVPSPAAPANNSLAPIPMTGTNSAK